MLTPCPGYQDKAHNQDTPPLIVAYTVASCMLGTKRITPGGQTNNHHSVSFLASTLSLVRESVQRLASLLFVYFGTNKFRWSRLCCLSPSPLGSNHRRGAKRKRGALHEPLLSAQLWDTEVDGERRHPGGTVRSSWHCCRYASLFKTERMKEYFQIVSCFRIMIVNFQFLDMLLPHFTFSRSKLSL